MRDTGETALALLAEVQSTVEQLRTHAEDEALQYIAERLDQACSAYAKAVQYINQWHQDKQARAVYFGSVPFLMLAGTVLGGWKMAKSALACTGQEDEFSTQKRSTAVCYATYVLPRAQAHVQAIAGSKVMDTYSLYS